MNIAFISEMGFVGKVPQNHPNMRTEFAWMYALNANHHCIYDISNVKGYDHVFVIFPKGRVFLSAEGSKIIDGVNPVSDILRSPFVSKLKESNNQVHYIQEGPHWWFNDYEMEDQINFYNMLQDCDSIFTHNEHDLSYYKGLLPQKKVSVMPTVMIEEGIKGIKPIYEDKVIVGGNFVRWYGGFESYAVASNFNVPIWTQTSHATREGEDQLMNILPRLIWLDWMGQLSKFKYAVHLMPTVAAGTFSLNCAYFGIPCIGNKNVDTQRICHPSLSVDVNDIERARKLACTLRGDKDFYEECSKVARENYNSNYTLDIWKSKMTKFLQ